jgi:hypothetical protein
MLDDHRLATRRTRLVRRLVFLALVLARVARVFAVRVRRAREELAEPAAALEQRLSAPAFWLTISFCAFFKSFSNGL